MSNVLCGNTESTVSNGLYTYWGDITCSRDTGLHHEVLWGSDVQHVSLNLDTMATLPRGKSSSTSCIRG
jgi:hypothetical protein